MPITIFLSCRGVTPAKTAVEIDQGFKSEKLPVPNKLPIAPIYVDDQFSMSEIEIIRDAAKEWAFATHNKVQFTFFYFHHIPNREIASEIPFNIMIKIHSTDQFVFKMDMEDKHNILGFYRFIGGNFYIGLVFDRIINEQQFRSVVMHELGHSLGINHNNSEPAIMNSATGEEYKCLTKLDMDLFCDAYSCKSEDMLSSCK